MRLPRWLMVRRAPFLFLLVAVAVAAVWLAVAGPVRGAVGVDIIVLGGPGAVSDVVLARLGSCTSGEVTRVAGKDRFATAAAVSAGFFRSGVPVAYVSTGENFADALAGGPAAGRRGGPMLLVQRNTIPDTVRGELGRLAPGRIVVVGGSAVVSDAVVGELAEFTDRPVVRIAGSDRYATAAAVSRSTFPAGVDVAYVATGESFPDALSGGAAAISAQGPVVLVQKEALPDSAEGELRRLAPATIRVLGGTGAVGGSVFGQVGSLASAKRLWGGDRYATAAAVSRDGFAAGAGTILIATGENFPDALAGVPVSGKVAGPILLVRRDTIPDATENEIERLTGTSCERPTPTTSTVPPTTTTIVRPTTTTTAPPPTTSTSTTSTTSSTVPPVAGGQPVPPIRGAFMYPWFPNAWDQGGIIPFSRFTPSSGMYDSSDPDVIDRQVEQATGAGLEAFINSWWGPGHHTDAATMAVLDRIPQSPNPDFRIAIYYEEEGQSDPSPAAIRDDLVYLERLFDKPSYLRVDGKPVVFVWATGDGASMAKRWRDAKNLYGGGVHVVLKVFSGWRDVAEQPDSWHQYGPSTAYHEHLPWSAVVSPGFWHAKEGSPRLGRDPGRFRNDVEAMAASGAFWQLVTSWNEWGEGTIVEPADEFGTTYLDILSDVLGGG